MTIRKFLLCFTLTGAIYGALGFIYIAGNAWFHPQTLPLPLTHFLTYPREDTFGALCFGFSTLCCLSYLLLRSMSRPN